jgi:hypothetical protein
VLSANETLDPEPAADVVDLLYGSWHYLPTRTLLDLRGSGDVFTY